MRSFYFLSARCHPQLNWNIPVGNFIYNKDSFRLLQNYCHMQNTSRLWMKEFVDSTLISAEILFKWHLCGAWRNLQVEFHGSYIKSSVIYGEECVCESRQLCAINFIRIWWNPNSPGFMTSKKNVSFWELAFFRRLCEVLFTFISKAFLK